MARLRGQKGGSGPVLGIIIGLIILALLYLFVLAPLFNLPYEMNAIID